MEKSHRHKANRRSLLLITSVAVMALIGSVFLVGARTQATIDITVRNNTQRQILHLYLAAGDPNNWGPDQLNGSTIPPGGSHVLNDVACSGSTIRVIAEDQNGCFVYYNASCDADQTWEITDAVTPDCGG